MYVLLRYIGVSLNLFISIYRGTGTNPTIGERDAFNRKYADSLYT